MTVTTPRSLIDSVVRSASGREVTSIVRLTAGGLNEAYRVEPARGEPMVVRIARRPEPWFVDEEYAMARARGDGYPDAGRARR